MRNQNCYWDYRIFHLARNSVVITLAISQILFLHSMRRSNACIKDVWYDDGIADTYGFSTIIWWANMRQTSHQSGYCYSYHTKNICHVSIRHPTSNYPFCLFTLIWSNRGKYGNCYVLFFTFWNGKLFTWGSCPNIGIKLFKSFNDSRRSRIFIVSRSQYFWKKN